MELLKCKCCGGNLDVFPEQKHGVCVNCGSINTLPNSNDEDKIRLLNRANDLRISNLYDSSLKFYEEILRIDDQDPEVYWSLLLAKYGIDYVVENGKVKSVVIHRLSNKLITADMDYLNVLKYSNNDERYVAEANKISLIQKRILNVASRETPFDVFICYKEKDCTGQRTVESIEAQKIHRILTKDYGYNVFFSRITLETNIGDEYEPIIFSALNSAKVMLVFGSSFEHLTAPWVKNEWSRFIEQTELNLEKKIIPCFIDMRAEQLPDDFLGLQAVDMSKIGWEQDLARGVSKVLGASDSTMTIPRSSSSSESDQLYKKIVGHIKFEEFKQASNHLFSFITKFPQELRGWEIVMSLLTKNYKADISNDILEDEEFRRIATKIRVLAKEEKSPQMIDALDNFFVSNKEYNDEVESVNGIYKTRRKTEFQMLYEVLQKMQAGESDYDIKYESTIKQLGCQPEKVISSNNGISRVLESVHYEKEPIEKQMQSDYKTLAQALPKKHPRSTKNQLNKGRKYVASLADITSLSDCEFLMKKPMNIVLFVFIHLLITAAIYGIAKLVEYTLLVSLDSTQYARIAPYFYIVTGAIMILFFVFALLRHLLFRVKFSKVKKMHSVLVKRLTDYNHLLEKSSKEVRSISTEVNYDMERDRDLIQSISRLPFQDLPDCVKALIACSPSPNKVGKDNTYFRDTWDRIFPVTTGDFGFNERFSYIQ